MVLEEDGAEPFEAVGRVFEGDEDGFAFVGFEPEDLDVSGERRPELGCELHHLKRTGRA
jgi:hypothetical protein